MISPSIAIELHQILHVRRCDPTVEHGARLLYNLHGQTVNVDRIRTKSQDFYTAMYSGFKLITQNLMKPSQHTRWVMVDPESRQITWITKQHRYVQRTRQFVNESGQLTLDVTIL